MGRLPNFIVIGAPKSGTTSLYQYFNKHPEIFMSPKKETWFLAHDPDTDMTVNWIKKNIVTSEEEYRELFDGVTDEHKAWGEASPIYLYSDRAKSQIDALVPDAKLILILRNPIERAYSHYMNYIRDEYESEMDFYKALQEDWIEKKGEKIRRNYSNLGFYGRDLRRYSDKLESGQLKVYLYDDLRKDRDALLKDMFEFLGVSSVQVEDTEHYNQSGVPKSKLKQKIYMSLLKPGSKSKSIRKMVSNKWTKKLYKGVMHGLTSSNYEKKEMPENARAFLNDMYKEDIKDLESQIGRDLSHWLK